MKIGWIFSTNLFKNPLTVYELNYVYKSHKVNQKINNSYLKETSSEHVACCD
jgi:hypothetical protein